MKVRRVLRELFLGLVLCGGSILGVPMRPEEIEELMACMSKPNVEFVVDERETDNDQSTELTV
jgi:hypothetical protein